MNFPSFHGNWIDLIVLIIVCFYVIGGWRKGLIQGIIDLIGLTFSFLAALRFYSIVGQFLTSNFDLPKSIANAGGFFIAGTVVEAVVLIAIRFLTALIDPKLSQFLTQTNHLLWIRRLEHLLGLIPAIIESLIFTSFILILAVALPILPSVKKDILNSKIGGSLVISTQAIEKNLNGIFLPAISDTISFLTVNPESSGKINLHFTQTNLSTDFFSEDKMLILINQERIKVGQKTLSKSIKLQEIARSYGQDMFKRGYFSHYNPEGQSPFDRMKASGIVYTSAGENLALAPNVLIAHSGLMNSEGHRTNILSSDFSKVGIGVIDGGIYGDIFVQEFTD